VTALAITVLVVVALLGAPLFAVVLGAALLGFRTADVDLVAVPGEFYQITTMQFLLSIPLFTFAGYLLAESQAPRRLVRMTNLFLGWLPGGLAIVALAACAFFTAFTGASGVTIVALGALLYPALKQGGYGEDFSLGLLTTSGSLGLLFVPSLPLILYGVVAGMNQDVGGQVTVDKMFLAGILPGALMLLLLSAWSFREGRHRPSRVKVTWAEAKAALRESLWELPLPGIVLGGIYSGYFAVSETAAVTVIYVLLVEVGIYREIPVARLPKVMRDAMVLVGGVLIILGATLASTSYLIYAEVPSRLVAFVSSHVASKWTFLLLLNGFLLILGMLLDVFSSIVLVVPLILPIAATYGVDPVHLGIIFLANMQIGYCTPPVGMSLFIASYRFEQPVSRLFRATLPFLAILLICVLVITYWPPLSLALVGK
jgi:tripartite ATP-independent transporter DctM subunit